LQLEQKALQLQMNPHFIFNALNSIQALVATKDYSTARTQIGNFATLMRSILSNSRKQRITLQEEIDTLDQYLKMEQFCQRVGFDYEIIPPNNMDSEEVELPPMLLQPFVENSIIHGISHLESDGKITVEFQVHEKLLECRIIDNGVGRKKADEFRQSRKPGHQSVAMSVTKERLHALKDGMNYTPFKIKDILGRDGKILGTKVVVRMVLEVGF
jgi:sensor histidine kinase YesM